MATYGKKRYGESRYGTSSTHSGTYTSRVFNIGNTTTVTDIEVSVIASLPTVTYNTEDIVYNGTWEAGTTNDYSSSYVFATAFSKLKIIHSTLGDHDDAEITVEKFVDDVLVATNTVSTGNEVWDGSDLTEEYAEYRVTVKKANNDDKPLTFKALECCPVLINIQNRVGTSTTAWQEWQTGTQIPVLLADGNYKVSLITSPLDSVNLLQTSITLTSSDSNYSPTIYKLEVARPTSDTRETEGTWQCIMYFDETNFKEYLNIDWTTNQEDKVSIITQSSIDNTIWSPESGRYTKVGEQLRLEDGFLTGSILTQAMEHENAQQWIQYKTSDWVEPNSVGSIKYQILVYDNTSGEYVANNYYSPKEAYTNLDTKDTGAKIKIKTILTRTELFRPSPRVSSINLKCHCSYSELKAIPCSISTMSNNFTGRKELLVNTLTTIKGLDFDVPTDCPVKYYWVKTTTKNFISLYWKSQDTFGSEPGAYTDNINDTLCIKCIAHNNNPIHYQRLSSIVTYPNVKSIDLKNKQFIPILKEGTTYDFYATHGRLRSDYSLDLTSTRERTPVDLKWNSLDSDGKSTIWNFIGNVEWSVLYQAWKCTGDCQIYLKNAVGIVNGANYTAGIKVLAPNGATINWGGVRVDENGADLTTVNFVADNTTIPQNQWSSYTGDWEGSSFSLRVGGTIEQADDSITYLRDISFYNINEGRVIDLYWADESVTTRKNWNMVRENLNQSLCISIYLARYKLIPWTSQEIMFYNQTINSNNIKSPMRTTLVSPNNLPEIPEYIKSDAQPYYLAIVKNSVRKGGVEVENTRVQPVDMELVDDNEEILEYKLDVKFELVSPPAITMTRGSTSVDTLPYDKITTLVVMKNEKDKYDLGVDYTLIRTQDTSSYITDINWVSAINPGTQYYIDIDYYKPSQADIEFTCNHTESIVYREAWTSKETLTKKSLLNSVKNSEVFVLPKVKFSFTLSGNNGGGAWDYSDIEKLFPSIKDIKYKTLPSTIYYSVTNNNPLVKSVSEHTNNGYYIRNTIDRDLLTKWYPYIHNGYYYIGEQRYYKYLSPTKLTITPSEVIDARIKLPSEPNLNAPIIVKKADGSFLRKVAFIDSITGDFVLYNKENIVWDRTHKDGYAKLKVSYDELEVDNFDTILYNYTDIIASSTTPKTPDNKLAPKGLEIQGANILANISDENILYEDAYLSVLYKPKDCFTYDANTNIITLSQEYNQNVYIYYETSAENYGLIESVDINPMFNLNHSGFLYIPNADKTVNQLRVHLSRDRVRADGISTIYINITPIDKYGNSVNTANITASISDRHSSIYSYNTAQLNALNGTLSEIKQIGFGQYYYVYTAPMIKTVDMVSTKYIYITIREANVALKKKIELVSVY